MKMVKLKRKLKVPRSVPRLVSKKIIGSAILFYSTLILWSVLDYRFEPPQKKETHYSAATYKRTYLNYTTKPTVVYWTYPSYETDRPDLQCIMDCEIYYGNVLLPPDTEGAYAFYGFAIKFNDLPLPRNPSKVIWGLFHEESPIQVIEFAHERTLNLFNYSSTFSRNSDVPCPLQFMVSLENVTGKTFFIETAEKNRLLGELAPILYLQSDCKTATDRDKFVENLSLYLRIDSYGRCLNNKNVPFEIKGNREYYVKSMYDENFLKFVARYKFVIGIENAACEDYVTEKFWRAIHVGVVPIYFGTPTIRDWMPNPKSAILIDDFSDVKSLSDHIDFLMKHDDKYEEYLEHKTKGLVTNKNLLNEIRLRPNQTAYYKERVKNFLCFLCEKLHEKNRTSQIVTTKQYNCPKPTSVLTHKVEADNSFVPSWKFSKRYSYFFYDKIIKQQL